jgi:hypothetical protein
MYVRWQPRKLKRPQYGWPRQDVAWRAIIVESVRVDGKPRQRHVAYLTTFTESMTAIAGKRGWFWNQVTERLDSLGKRISADDRDRIETAIEAKVPRLTTQQYNECVGEEAAVKAAARLMFADPHR